MSDLLPVSDEQVQRGAHVGAEAELRDVPHILLPYQQAWVADQSRLKVAEKSRRIGLSWAEAADCALHAASTSGSNVYYMSYEMSMTRQFVDDCAWWAKWYGLAAGEVYETVWLDDKEEHQVFRIDFASGWHIQALSSAPRNLRSKQGRAVFDEYAFTDEAKQSELLKAGLAFLIWGGDVHVISTHNGVTNGFNVLVQEIREGRRPGTVHRTTFDQAIEQGLYRRIALLKGLDPSPEAEAAWADDVRGFYADGAAEELDVIPSKGGGKYFNRVLLEANASADIETLHLAYDDDFVLQSPQVRQRVVDAWIRDELLPAIERAADPDKVSVYGMDFARKGDISVIWPAQIEADLTRRVLVNIELRNVPFQQQTQICVALGKALPRFKFAAHDASGNGAQVAEDTAAALGTERVAQVKLSARWYEDNFPRYRGLYDDQRIIIPADVDVVDDHMRVELVRGVPGIPDGNRPGSEGERRHADAAVAGVMMAFAAEQDGEPAAPVASTSGYGSTTRSGLVMPGAVRGNLFDRFRRSVGVSRLR